MSIKLKEEISKWLYRSFMYFVPGGFALYTFVIEKLMDDNVSWVGKIGVSGIFIVAVMFLIAVFFLGKYFRKRVSNITNQILECMDDAQKLVLIEKKRKIEAKQELFHNAIFLAPFVIIYVLLILVEKQTISLRGTFGTICISMAIGMGFSVLEQYLHVKGAKKIDEE